MRVTLTNHGPEAHVLHALPHLLARNTWSYAQDTPRPRLRDLGAGVVEALRTDHPAMRWFIDGADALMFCENETNLPRVFGTQMSGIFKDGIGDALLHDAHAAISPNGEGTKCAAHWKLLLQPGESRVLRLRFRLASIETAPSRISMPCSQPGLARQQNSIAFCRRAWRARMRGWYKGRRLPGCCGRSNSIISM